MGAESKLNNLHSPAYAAMSGSGQRRPCEDIRRMSGLRTTSGPSRGFAVSLRGAKAQNRCAIARCAGSPTASAVIGGEIVNSGRGALS